MEKRVFNNEELHHDFKKDEGNKHPDVNRKIWKLLKKLNLEKISKKTNAFICGGSILTLFYENRVISNIDIFFNTLEDLNKFKDFVSEFEDCEIIDEDEYTIHFKYKTKHIKLYKKNLGTPQEVLNNFDFTICQIAFVPKQNCFVMHQHFLWHIETKQIVINQSVPFPLSSIDRITKYASRGFQISSEQSMILALLINKVRVEEPDDMINWINETGSLPVNMECYKET
jgi:hypothetical protein